MYVPINLRSKMVKKHYDGKIYEHSKVKKIMQHIQRNYYFSKMRKLIEKHVVICVECNQNKATRHKPYKKMKTLTIPIKK